MASIGIIGSEGRMGQALAALLSESGHALAGGADIHGLGAGDAAALADRSDVLVDFSSPVALEANLHAAIGAGIPIVVGTTGLTDRHHTAIDHAAHAVPVLQTGNTSLGVALLAHLVGEAAARLGPEWDIEIVEMHHRLKVYAPSGTALLLGEAAAGGARHPARYQQRTRPGWRYGGSRRGSDRVRVLARRHCGGRAQRHRRRVRGAADAHAQRREPKHLPRGAIRAAEWLIGKPAGRYTMAQVLDL